MPSSDLGLQKNALNTETRIATHSIKVQKAMLTGIPNIRNSTTKECVFHNVRKSCYPFSELRFRFNVSCMSVVIRMPSFR